MSDTIDRVDTKDKIAKSETNANTRDGIPELKAGVHALLAEDRKKLEKSLKRKLDYFMLPIIVLIYIL